MGGWFQGFCCIVWVASGDVFKGGYVVLALGIDSLLDTWLDGMLGCCCLHSCERLKDLIGQTEVYREQACFNF